MLLTHDLALSADKFLCKKKLCIVLLYYSINYSTGVTISFLSNGEGAWSSTTASPTCTKMLVTMTMFMTPDTTAGIGPLDRTYASFLLRNKDLRHIRTIVFVSYSYPGISVGSDFTRWNANKHILILLKYARNDAKAAVANAGRVGTATASTVCSRVGICVPIRCGQQCTQPLSCHRRVPHCTSIGQEAIKMPSSYSSSKNEL